MEEENTIDLSEQLDHLVQVVEIDVPDSLTLILIERD